MAYINVAEWTPDQVTDWLKGLDDTMYNYVYSFTNNEVGGRQLLNIRPYELEQLGMHCIGHQEIVLEAVEILRNFHYNLDKENLQFMALHVATAARNLHRQLTATHCDASKIETQVLNDITRTIATMQPLIGWLDRAPFHGQLQFNEIRRNMLRLGLEMATSAQRDRFVQNPVDQIKATAEKLERLANYIIQDITDPMLLQPASLNLVTLKKRESELGFNIVSSYHGIHRIADIKYNSPAHNCGKIEDGDEIVQINYQTVVGWQYKTVVLQLRESLPDVLLTLKKRPKHMKIYGQIYMQPYRLPSKKRTMATRWGTNLPSPPRAGFLAAKPDFNKSLQMNEKSAVAAKAIAVTAVAATCGAAAIIAASATGGGASSDTDSSCSDILTPTCTKAAAKEMRLYYPKPRAMLQRRNTICGDELCGRRERHISSVAFWHERKVGGSTPGDPATSPSLRDKSISFGFGLELTPRPTTCIGIGIASGGAKIGAANEMKSSLLELKCRDNPPAIRQLLDAEHLEPQESVAESVKSKPGISKVVRFGANMKSVDYKRLDDKFICNVEDTILETFEPIPYVDDEEIEAVEAICKEQEQTEINITETEQPILELPQLNLTSDEPSTPSVASVVRRGRLDKSHSTPAYDNSEGESDTPPPAIEPRKEFLLVTPPLPPPRPKKQSELAPPNVPPPPPKPANLRVTSDAVVIAKPPAAIPPAEDIIQDQPIAKLPPLEEHELHTPTKTAKILTLKKKNSLISKRRKINLKLLGTGDIQGHLYRRTKDRRGVTYWARFYFVLLDTNLYGFRVKEASKANCLIFLPGFTVSLAKEVHSKSYAFKVYHPSKTFYLATESQEALNQWIDFIRQATLQSKLDKRTDNCSQPDINIKQLYSETESSGDETETAITKNLSTPSPQNIAKDASTTSSINLCKSLQSSTPTTSTTTKHENKRYLGSLRKFTKSSFMHKSSAAAQQNERKMSNDIPVPTEQYRSYRKVPGGSFGIQIGTNTPGYHDATLLQSIISSNSNVAAASSNNRTTETTSSPPPPPPSPPPPPMPQRKRSLSSSHSSMVSASADSIDTSLGPPTTQAPTPTAVAPSPSSISALYASQRRNKLAAAAIASTSSSSSSFSFESTPSRSFQKASAFPCNFIHASNPNLVEFDFQTSKTLDYSLPKINAANAWDAHPTMQGFVTLKDLMLQKQEEEAQEMYNNRVLLGVERKTDGRNMQRNNEEQQQACDAQNQQQQQPQQQQHEKWTQKRSLPKTPDYEISFKPDDEDIKRTRTKEGLKLRDFGYELISGDEPIAGKDTTTSDLISKRQNCFELQQQQQAQLENSWSAAMKTRQILKAQQLLLSSHSKNNNNNKKHSSNSCSSSSTASGTTEFAAVMEKRAGSFKKGKGKLEAFKTSKERIFQFGKHATPQTGAMTMTLPHNKKLTDSPAAEQPTTAAGITTTTGAIQHTSTAVNSIKKSHTYNSELKEKAGHHATSTMVVKEKKLLGSPLLHRTLFGHAALSPLNTPPTTVCTGREYDQEIFSQVHFTKVPNYHSESAAKFRNLSASNGDIVAPDVLAPPPPIAVQTTTDDGPPPLPPHGTDIAPRPPRSKTASMLEYPNMECPPVFEPEIYSLTDPNANLTFLRKRNNSNNIDSGTVEDDDKAD